MTDSTLPRSRQEIEAQIVTKAWADEAFAQALKTDPVAAVEKELGIKVTDGLRIEIHDESQGSPVWHLVIPPRPPANEADLSEGELDAVAGGIRMISSYNLTLNTRFHTFFAFDPGRGP